MEVIHIKIGFIGPGKVGVNLGRYFTHKGVHLSGFYGKTLSNTEEAAKVTNSKFYNNIQDIIKDSDIIFITTPDDNISIIDREISQFDLTNKSICHASGSLKSTELSHAKLSGAYVYSIHPIFPFSNKNINLIELEKIYFSIEGDLPEEFATSAKATRIPIISLIEKLENPYFIRNEENASTYHLANVFVSNLTLSLLDIGTRYLMTLGLEEKQAFQALLPLIEGNIESIAKKGFVNSLTGPIARGDANTIRKHFSALSEEDKELYNTLSLHLLKMVAHKENGMSNLLEKSEKYLEIYQLLGGLEF